MIEHTTETGEIIKTFAVANGEVIWSNRQDLFLYTTEEVCHADWKSRNRVSIPKGTRIKVYDIMRNFYGLWAETYYEGRYYSIDPRCLEYRGRTKLWRQTMTNEELKKKICDIIAPYVSAYGDDERIADALITAGIGDVKEAEMAANRYEMLYKLQNRDMALAERRAHDVEHRAARAERALDKAVELAYEFRTEADTLSCSSCPMFHIFDSCKERGLYQDCSKQWKEELIKQAEKELAEEGKE